MYREGISDNVVTLHGPPQVSFTIMCVPDVGVPSL